MRKVQLTFEFPDDLHEATPEQAVEIGTKNHKDIKLQIMKQVFDLPDDLKHTSRAMLIIGQMIIIGEVLQYISDTALTTAREGADLLHILNQVGPEETIKVIERRKMELGSPITDADLKAMKDKIRSLPEKEV